MQLRKTFDLAPFVVILDESIQTDSFCYTAFDFAVADLFIKTVANDTLQSFVNETAATLATMQKANELPRYCIFEGHIQFDAIQSTGNKTKISTDQFIQFKGKSDFSEDSIFGSIGRCFDGEIVNTFCETLLSGQISATLPLQFLRLTVTLVNEW